MIALVLLAMIFVACSQIALRNLSVPGFSFGDALLRHLVLWVGMLGAMVATRENRHINIDVVQHLVKGRVRSTIRALNSGVASLVCGILCVLATRFVGEEMEMGMIAFASVPTWVSALIMPLAFGVMALRFATASLLEVHRLITGTSGEEVAES